MAAFARRYVTERRDLYPKPKLSAGLKIGRSTIRQKGGHGAEGAPR